MNIIIVQWYSANLKTVPNISEESDKNIAKLPLAKSIFKIHLLFLLSGLQPSYRAFSFFLSR